MFHLDSASPGGLLALSAILVATLIALPDRSLAAPGDEWTVRGAPSSAPLGSVTWGDGRFVAVGDNRTGPGAVLTSPDGITWTAREAVLADWTSVARGNDTFVAVSTFLPALPGGSARDRVMTSPDGITWTPRVASANNDWRSIAWGNGTFVAVSDSDFGGSINDRVMTSPDGITWTNRTASAESSWTSVAYGNGVFVAVAKSDPDVPVGQVMTSTDGVNWTTRTPPVTADWTSVTWGGQGFVAVAGSGTSRVMTSPDGITWTARTAASQSTWTSVAWGNGAYVAVGDGAVMTSPDGITWTGRTPAAPVGWSSVAAAPGMFVAVADGPSGDGQTARIMTSGAIPGPPPPPPTPAKFTRLVVKPPKRKARAVRAPKKIPLTIAVTNSGDTGGRAVISLKSSAKGRVRVPARVSVTVPAGTTRRAKVRATVKPRRRGKVRITARVGSLRAVSTLVLRR